MVVRFYCSIVISVATPVSAQQDFALFGAIAEPLRAISELFPHTGRTADSSAGRAGERQTGDMAIVVQPTARVNGRIANRVQSRISNRIDRNYDPQPNVSSSFKTTGEAAARAGRSMGQGL